MRWVNAFSLVPEEMDYWLAGTNWLRSLEGRGEPRLFGVEECLEKEWWESQCAILVFRRPTQRRLRLPLGKEIDVCVEALLPHAAMWLLEMVGEKHLELAMHPKTLIQRVFPGICLPCLPSSRWLLSWASYAVLCVGVV